MERKIEWNSYCYDEIELVYEKAEKDERIAALLLELEEMALREAEENCGFLMVNDRRMTKEMFLGMANMEKAQVIYHLSGVGLEGFNASKSEPIITVTLSSHIQMVLGCTVFSILNRLEKLDGAYNEVLFPKATLEILTPLGSKKGLAKCEMLIMALYPWLSVSEKSRDVISAPAPTPTLVNTKSAAMPAEKGIMRLLGRLAKKEKK